jgi:glyoxylase-like metal-dependent hydrolase (beta-lactamase superfamily II)
MKLGQFELYPVSDGYLWLDGGAMFGVVPKMLWQGKTTPDEKNRIRLGLNCLLVKAHQKRILIDTGCGFKYTDKDIEIYGIEHPTDIVQELRHCGVAPEEIDFVINTHYHFDHCGGNTRVEGDEIVPTFPRASYVVRRDEYEDACHPNQRTAATYFSHNWKPLEERGLLWIVDEDQEILPGVTLIHTPGHTAGHQSVKLESQGQTLFFMADLCPTSAHVPLPWIMGYDLFPLTTLEVRKGIYQQALDEQWLLMLEHDPDVQLGYLRHENGRHFLDPVSWQE